MQSIIDKLQQLVDGLTRAERLYLLTRNVSAGRVINRAGGQAIAATLSLASLQENFETTTDQTPTETRTN